MLVPDIEKKLAFRAKTIESVRGNFDNKEARYKTLWKTRLENQMSQLPEYEMVYRYVHRVFKEADLLQK